MTKRDQIIVDPDPPEIVVALFGLIIPLVVAAVCYLAIRHHPRDIAVLLVTLGPLVANEIVLAVHPRGSRRYAA